jgi:hypothetical protein
MTTTYAVLLPGDESYWDTASPEERQAVYAKHEAFAKALAERGHTVTGGAELTHSRGTKLLRGAGDDLTVTAGPYAETVEQLTGFYLVQSDDVDDLIEVCKILASSDGAIEVRACVDHSGGDTTG